MIKSENKKIKFKKKISNETMNSQKSCFETLTIWFVSLTSDLATRKKIFTAIIDFLQCIEGVPTNISGSIKNFSKLNLSLMLN